METMEAYLKVNREEFAPADVRETISYALSNAMQWARLRRDYYEQLCRAFEARQGLSSDDFLSRFEAGMLGDEGVWFDWYAAKRGYDLWKRRLQILGGFSL